MERRPETRPQNSGTNLYDLIPFAESSYLGSGPRTSPHIYFLAEAMETEDFWLSLNNLLAEDDKQRHSIGGVFYRETGGKPIGQYTWNKLYSSLDSFMKSFEGRATEFIFKDFSPKNPNIELKKVIEATRTLAYDKYPRLRRINWDDYRQQFNTTSFWQSLIDDLSKIEAPVSITRFFYHAPIPTEGRAELSQIPTALERESIRKFKRGISSLSARSQFLSYQNMSQIIRDMASQNPREFLLGFEPESNNQEVLRLCLKAKELLAQKILPPQEKGEKLKHISKSELQRIVRNQEFWATLAQDLENHFSSSEPAYSFHFFLRNYDRETNEINQAKLGEYAVLATPFLKKQEGAMRSLIKQPSEELVDFLMWQFKAPKEIEELVTDVKRMATELFQNDSLYVELQLPEFWDQFEIYLDRYSGNVSFFSFLRYVSQNNPNADHKKNSPGTAPFQRIFHRAYHKSSDFIAFCRKRGIEDIGDYKQGLVELFERMAPIPVRVILKEKFPKEFGENAWGRRQDEIKLFAQTKEFLLNLSKSGDEVGIVTLDEADSPEKIRNKLQSASRILGLTITTSFVNGQFLVRIRETGKRSKQDLERIENEVIKGREQGLQNKEIARRLGIAHHDVEYAVTKLVKKGIINRRREMHH